MPATATASRPSTAVLWFVPLTINGYGNTIDCYVLAASPADARASAVMAGIRLADRPGTWVAAGIPRKHQEIPAGRCVAVAAPAPEGERVWNFGSAPAERLRNAQLEGRLECRVTEVPWYRPKV